MSKRTHDLLPPSASRTAKQNIRPPAKDQPASDAAHAEQNATSAVPARDVSQVRTSNRAAGSKVRQAPQEIHDTLRSTGESLDNATRASMNRRLAYDFSHVRIHHDAKAAKSAEQLDALAFTVGRDIVFARGQYHPDHTNGASLLAHELMHVKQQGGARPVSQPGVLDDEDLEGEARMAEAGASRVPAEKSLGAAAVQRTPAVPTGSAGAAAYDRSLVTIDPIHDVSNVASGTVAAQTAQVSVTATGAKHMTWEIYNADDTMIDGFSTTPKSKKPLTEPFVVDDKVLKKSVKEGRYTLRCIARDGATAIAYADQTFYVWATNPLVKQGRPELAAILSSPGSKSLGEVGAAKARDMMLEHQETLAKTGTGTIQGNQCGGTAPAGTAQTDCTQYVYDILKYAFGAKGSASVWAEVAKEAKRLSGSGGLRGTALQTALETKAGWKGVFWAPSPQHPEDGTSEHPAAYKRVKAAGLYSSDDVAVGKTKSIVDFRPKASTHIPDFTRLDQLKKVPLGVISARGGKHMTLVLSGQVYEVHWDKPATDPDVIEATPLEKWQWQSGAIVMPKESYDGAIGL